MADGRRPTRRTIAVDVPVIIPEVERVPVVQVSAPLWTEVPERLGLPVTKADGWMIVYEDENLLAQRNGDDASGEAATVWGIDPEARERADIQVYCNPPLDQRLGANWWYTSDYYYPYEVDPETVFAEENELSLANAQDMLKRLLTYYYGEEYADFDMDYIEVRGRARKRIGNRYEDLGDYKKDYPKGTYFLSFRQKIDGIPVYLNMGEKKLTTDAANFTPEISAKWGRIYGDNFFEYMDASSFMMNTEIFNKEVELVEDVPLAPVDAIISRLEQEIDAGLLRNVYALRLGYVSYLDEGSPDTYSLYPMWICDCEYAESAKQKFEVNIWSDEFRESFYYQQILIDAQTCEVVSGWVTEDEDLYHAEPVTWDDV